MPDLADGESVEMKGSARLPYILKNTGGVYSCTCPAWRNQSIGIEQRTCKHLRKYRGEEAETARLGAVLPARPASETGEEGGTAGPPLLLAQSWDNELDLSGWFMSEKLDGVRAYWDGQQIISRQGNLYHAPDWFLETLPPVALDGELWLDRKAFQRTVSIVRRQDKSEHWRQISFLVFDAPDLTVSFEERQAYLQETLAESHAKHLKLLEQQQCRSLDHLREELARIEALGGEGVMLREPGSKYEVGRSSTLMKVKTFHDAEARVIDHQAGAGRHKGRMGALVVELPNGTQFSVGTGFSDAQRNHPPAVGTTITFRYQELSDRGVPRFPSFVRMRVDAPPSIATTEAAGKSAQKKNTSSTDSEEPIVVNQTVKKVAAGAKPAQVANARYFEFVDDKSSKFWELTVESANVTVRFGKIGTAGQSKTTSFADDQAALMQSAKLITEKTAKGYIERVTS
jgi:DNA ligase 1